MKVVNPNDENHIIELIPRNNEGAGAVLEIYNETTKEIDTIRSDFSLNISYEVIDGVGVLNVIYDFKEKQKYQLKLSSVTPSDNIIYRGKVLASTQETQDYKLTKDLYYYE